MTDKVDEAIVRAERTIEMMSIPVTIGSTGRPVQLAVPVDMSDLELIEFVSWLTRELYGELLRRRSQTPASRIIVPKVRPC